MRTSELVGLGRLAVKSPSQLLIEIRQHPALMLLVANLSAQAIGVGLSPVLSRMYSPKQFGVLGALTALVMIGVPLTAWRYELAIPRARSDRESFELLHVCGVVIGLMTVLFSLLSLSIVHLSTGAWSENIRDYWYFVPIALGFVTLYDTLAMEASRSQQLAPLAGSKIRQSVLGVGAQITFGALGFGTAGLLLGFVINQAAGVTRLFRILVLGHRARGALTWADLRATAQRHRHFPMYASWSSALDSSTKWGLQLAISTLWDPRVGGFVFLADRIIGRPLLLLSTSLLPVYVAEVSHAMHHDPRAIPAIFRATLRKQGLVSGAWMAVVVAAAPLVIGPLFGANWAEAVPYVQLTAVAVAPVATLHSVAHTLQLAARQRLQSVLVLTKSTVIFATLTACYLGGVTTLTTLASFALVQVAFAVVTYFVFARVAAEMATEVATTAA